MADPRFVVVLEKTPDGDVQCRVDAKAGKVHGWEVATALIHVADFLLKTPNQAFHPAGEAGDDPATPQHGQAEEEAVSEEE